MSEWTDTQDEAAYRMFSRMAAEYGPPHAVGFMDEVREVLMAPFADRDLRAWVLRWEEEEGGLPPIPSVPRESEYMRLYLRYMDVRR